MGSSGTENTGGIATTLAATLVPDINLDVYIYIKQLAHTTIPQEFDRFGHRYPDRFFSYLGCY